MKKMFTFVTICLAMLVFVGTALAATTSMWDGHHFYGFRADVNVNGVKYKKFDMGEWLSGDWQTSGFVTLPGNEGTNAYSGVSAESYFTNAGISGTTVKTLKTIVSAYEELKAGYVSTNPLYYGNPYAFRSTYGSLAQLLIWETLYDNVLPDSVSAFSQGNFMLNGSLPNNMYKEGFQGALDIFLGAMKSANPYAILFTTHYTVNTLQDSPAILSYDGYSPTATPVPAAIWLMGTGVVGLVALRRRRS